MSTLLWEGMAVPLGLTMMRPCISGPWKLQYQWYVPGLMALASFTSKVLPLLPAYGMNPLL